MTNTKQDKIEKALAREIEHKLENTKLPDLYTETASLLLSDDEFYNEVIQAREAYKIASRGSKD